MADLLVSLGVLGVTVILSELSRRTAARLSRAPLRDYLLEASSTFQLCCCSHELKLLGDSGKVGLSLGLSLTYAMTVVHLLSFRGAFCNPCGVLDKFCRKIHNLRTVVLLIACQFAAAMVARWFAASIWSLGLSEVHARHRGFGFRCFDPLGGRVLEATAVELVCAFIIQAAAMNVHRLDEKLRAPFIALVVTVLVYTGGRISGAFFNPVLAFSVLFPCSGHTYQEYCFIYWLGPALGVSSCFLLLEKIVPFLSGRNHIKQKTS